LHHYKSHTLQFSAKLQTGRSILHTLQQPDRNTPQFFVSHKKSCGRTVSTLPFQSISRSRFNRQTFPVAQTHKIK